MMLRSAALLAALAGLVGAAAPAAAQQAATGTGGSFRVLDKITGDVTDVELQNGQAATIGHLTIALGQCRYPADNASGDAYEWLTIFYQSVAAPVFQGWMIASAPALNAMDHPRYDVWALRCTTS